MMQYTPVEHIPDEEYIRVNLKDKQLVLEQKVAIKLMPVYFDDYFVDERAIYLNITEKAFKRFMKTVLFGDDFEAGSKSINSLEMLMFASAMNTVIHKFTCSVETLINNFAVIADTVCVVNIQGPLDFITREHLGMLEDYELTPSQLACFEEHYFESYLYRMIMCVLMNINEHWFESMYCDSSLAHSMDDRHFKDRMKYMRDMFPEIFEHGIDDCGNSDCYSCESKFYEIIMRAIERFGH